MKRFFKITGLSLLVLIALPIAFVIFTQLWYYASYPIYSFHEPQAFAGSYFYNPYEKIVSSDWRKASFHMHSESWFGLTHGDNSRQEVLEVYKALGYEITAISNYMTVDTGGIHAPSYIPCYEHGYGYGKTHQLVMGNHGPILWRDYLLIQNSLSQKQYTLDLLKQRCEVLAVNHPDLRYGYTPEDFKYLGNYDLMEVLNGARHSVKYWDSALSNGHAVWITANDDSHGVEDLSWVQREVIYINTPTLNREDVLCHLSHGAAFAVSFPRLPNATLAEKQAIAAKVSFLQNLHVRNDSLMLKWSRPMSAITFIGDSGKVLAETTLTDYAVYPIQPQNTYVRIVLTDEYGLTYFLNPVVRTPDGYVPIKQQLAMVDVSKTQFKYLSIIACIILVGGALTLVACRKKRRSHRG